MHKTALLTQLQIPVKTQTVTFWPTGYISEVSTTPCLGLIHLLEWFTGLRKPVYSLDYLFITRILKMKYYMGGGLEQRNFFPPGGIWDLDNGTWKCSCSLIWTLSESQYFFFFMGASVYSCDWLHHCSLMIDLSSNPLF